MDTMPVLLGRLHSSSANDTTNNPSSSETTTGSSALDRARSFSRRRSSSIHQFRSNNVVGGNASLQEKARSSSSVPSAHTTATTTTATVSTATASPKVRRNTLLHRRNTSKVSSAKTNHSQTVTELKITPPFPALKLSSLSLRSKSNPRISSRSPSPTFDTSKSPVLAPSPLITRTTSNGDGLLPSSICLGDLWADDRDEELQRSHSPSSFAERKSENINDAHQMTPRITISSFLNQSITMKDTHTPYKHASIPLTSGSVPLSPGLGRAFSESLVNFAARGWSSPTISRSTSPSGDCDDSTSTAPSSSASDSKSQTGEEAFARKRTKVARRTSLSIPSKKSRRPLTMMFARGAASDTVVSTVASLGTLQANAAENLPSPNMRPQGRRVKDQLWDAFRALGSDYDKFQGKPSDQKPNFMQQSLIPFLRNAEGKICNNIEPEELDRRVRLLHRWWTGLLAQLQNGTIGPNDKNLNLYLEGISRLMSRPEWRPPQSEFSPLLQQITKSNSTTSLSSDSSAFPEEKSVLHNVRSLYTRTIIDTLAYAVDSMTQRDAPPASVSFAGKVAAYAFFFCPGVAEVLVSLWHIEVGAVKRVVKQFELDKKFHTEPTVDKDTAESVVMGFPGTLHSLGYLNLTGALRQVRKKVSAPPGNTVDWFGPWTNRWLGRETDLLFVFLKYYHVLLCEFLPPNISPKAYPYAPGFVLIHAHILYLLDSSIQKPPSSVVPYVINPSLVTFDDVLAKASTLPVASGLLRSVSENKHLVLLRDVLTDKQLCSDQCRSIMFQSFSEILMAAALRTKAFDSEACLSLCDMMEDCLPVLRFAEKLSNTSVEYINWPFWLDIIKRMSETNNNMTELRLICMLYSTWALFVETPNQKREICLNWLLSPQVFERLYCHWCPMVRAYYMRLLCWRFAKHNGDESTALDKEILQVLSMRLRAGQAQFEKIKESADEGLIPLPTTTPCPPAPGQQLIILRNDTVAPQGIFVNKDGIITQKVIPIPAAKPDAIPKKVEPVAKKRWSLLRTLGLQSDSQSPPSSLDPSFTSENGIRNGSDPEITSSDSSQTQRKATFKFSLEWMPPPPPNATINPAALPASVQTFLDSLAGENTNVVDDGGEIFARSGTYIGRAMAEWVQTVIQRDTFFERRMGEGRDSEEDVETPALKWDSLKKL